MISSGFPSSRALIIPIILAAFLSLSYISYFQQEAASGAIESVTSTFKKTVVNEDNIFSDFESGARIHVAVEETAGYHNEVWPAFVHTLSSLPNVRTSLFLRNGSRILEDIGLQNIVNNIYDGPILDWSNDFLHALTVEEPEDERIDVVISTTCTKTMGENRSALLRILEQRKRPFRFVCVVHHTSLDRIQTLSAHLAQFVRLNSLVFLTLAEHTARSLREALGELTTTWDSSHDIGYSRVPIFQLVPVFPLPGKIASSSMQKIQRPFRAVIQGNIEAFRRNYKGIFNSLLLELDQNSTLWGWKAGHTPKAPYERDSSVSDPFQLYLLGHLKDKDLIPKQLENVVKIAQDLAYEEYWNTLHESQLVIPAFSRSEYFTHAASSSIAAAVLSRTPVLATGRHLSAYTYLDARGAVMRPDNVDAIEAIKRLRTTGTTLLPAEALAMRDREILKAFSWPRTNQEAIELQEDIYAENRDQMRKILTIRLPDYSFAVPVSPGE